MSDIVRDCPKDSRVARVEMVRERALLADRLVTNWLRTAVSLGNPMGTES